MRAPTQEEINDTIALLVRDGRLVVYRDEAGVVRFATAEWAAEHALVGVVLTPDQVEQELSANEARLMAEWN